MVAPVTIAFLAGLALGSYLPYLPLSTLVILVGAGLSLTLMERARRLTLRVGLLVYGALLAGLLAWTGASWPVPDRINRGQADGQTGTVSGTVVEPVRHAPGRLTAVLAPDAVPVGGRVRLTWHDPDLALRQGDRIAVTTRLHEPAAMVNPGGVDFEAYLARQSIKAVASVSGPGPVVLLAPAGGPRWALWRMVDGWRDRIREAAVQSLSGPALAIFLSIIIGEPGYVAPELRDRFMATGTVHLLSISGSHLGLIACLAFFGTRFLCRRLPVTWLLALSRRITATRLAALLTSVPVVLYTLLAGAEVATVRSLVMIAVSLLAVWAGREHRLLPALAFAALVILLPDPRALYSVSFQLSYVSVLAIALMLQRSRADQDRDGPHGVLRGWSLRRWLTESALVTGGVTLATAPLTAYYFNQIAWLGVLANLVVVPLVGVVLVPLGLGSVLWLLLGGGEELPAAALNQRGLDLLSDATGALAAIPGASWHVASPAMPALLGFYTCLWMALRGSAGRVVRGCGVLGVALVLGWWLWSPRTDVDGRTLRVTFLDVGQGDATVLELPDGQTVLIDGGARYDTLDMGRAVVGPFLWDRGIRRVDHVIGTHPQRDHVGGLAWVLDAFDVGAYWGNGVERPEGVDARLKEALARRGLAERVAQAGDGILAAGPRQAQSGAGPCRLEVLNPPGRAGPIAGGSRGSQLNNLAIVTRLDCWSHSFLFPADLEREGLARMRESGRPLQVEVVKVPHHGARSSLDRAWVREVDAEVAVISVGRRNPYSHPAPPVLEAYNTQGARLYRTDRDGAVWITARSSAGVEVQGTRGRRPQPVRLGRSWLEAEWRNLTRFRWQWMGPG